MSIFLPLLLSILSFFYSSSSSYMPLTSANSITLPLSRVALPSTNINNYKNNLLEFLKHHAAVSLQRAQLLKCSKNDDVVKTKVYPRDGFYSVHLGFGTPPQALHFQMDNASRLSWFPCTQNYTCTDCDFPDIETPQIFIPQSSSSYKPLACASPQCKWLLRDPTQCNKTSKYCPYKIYYWEGNTTGMLVSETLTFLPGGPGLSVNNFIAGCTVSSDKVPEGGILGLGRAQVSLPSQMGLKSFSYCMVSHEHNNNPNATSDLVLTMTTTTKGGGGGNNNKKVHYTPFATNPNIPDNPSLLIYYYVGLQSISVGGVNVRVPAQYLEPDTYNGSGGTVVDSGTTLTYMENPVFNLVFNEFQKQVIGNKLYKRDERAENKTGLGLCYDIGRSKNITLPQLTFTFQRGAKMVLPLPNYFTYMDDHKSVLCLTIVNGGEFGGSGPSIIIGNFQQQDYYMEYDLANNRLGILQQTCY